MIRVALAITVLAMLSAWPLTAYTTPAADSMAIRDIRGPLLPVGPPPFAGTVLLLLVAGLGLAIAVKSRKWRCSAVVSSPSQPPEIDELAALRNAYARDELPAVLLFQRLSAIARSRLIEGDSEAMTSAEILETAGKIASQEALAVAVDFFAVCDRVRFGGRHPDEATVTQAFAAVRQLLDHHSVTVAP